VSKHRRFLQTFINPKIRRRFVKKKISKSLKEDEIKNSKKTRKQKGKNFKMRKIDKIPKKQAPENLSQ
jgi:hypothetical protein